MEINLGNQITKANTILDNSLLPFRNVEDSYFLLFLTVRVLCLEPGLLFLIVKPISITQHDSCGFLSLDILEIVEDIEQSLILEQGQLILRHLLSFRILG